MRCPDDLMAAHRAQFTSGLSSRCGAVAEGPSTTAAPPLCRIQTGRAPAAVNLPVSEGEAVALDRCVVKQRMCVSEGPRYESLSRVTSRQFSARQWLTSHFFSLSRQLIEGELGSVLSNEDIKAALSKSRQVTAPRGCVLLIYAMSSCELSREWADIPDTLTKSMSRRKQVPKQPAEHTCWCHEGPRSELP